MGTIGSARRTGRQSEKPTRSSRHDKAPSIVSPKPSQLTVLPPPQVGTVEMLNCYYAHSEDDDKFQRRCYWLLSGDEARRPFFPPRHVPTLSFRGGAPDRLSEGYAGPKVPPHPDIVTTGPQPDSALLTCP